MNRAVFAAIVPRGITRKCNRVRAGKEHDVPITDNNTPPESPAARYRRRAEELRAMATGAQSVSVKDEFLALAQQYEKLADESRIMDRWR